MKAKLCLLITLFLSALSAQAFENIPKKFHGEWFNQGGCVFKYMHGENIEDEWYIGATEMTGFEWGGQLIKGTGRVNAQGVFTGKFKDMTHDGVIKTIRTFTPTPSGMTITEHKSKHIYQLARCTVDDYTVAMQRIYAVLIGQQGTDDIDLETARLRWSQYTDRPEFGLTPKDILKVDFFK